MCNARITAGTGVVLRPNRYLDRTTVLLQNTPSTVCFRKKFAPHIALGHTLHDKQEDILHCIKGCHGCHKATKR